MKLSQIKESQFQIWREMRGQIYDLLSNEFHEKEMAQIFKRNDWYCLFIIGKDDKIMGFVELSSRNIVDGCLSSPVAYIEGLYIKKEHQGKGIGKRSVDEIKIWCKEKGFTELGADTELENIKAQKFFESIGFHETYRIVEFCTQIK